MDAGSEGLSVRVPLAEALGRELVVREATTDAEIEAGFAELVKAGIAGLVVQNDPFFDFRRSHMLALSSRHRLPGIFHIREYPADGSAIFWSERFFFSRKIFFSMPLICIGLYP